MPSRVSLIAAFLLALGMVPGAAASYPLGIINIMKRMRFFLRVYEAHNLTSWTRRMGGGLFDMSFPRKSAFAANENANSCRFIKIEIF